MMEGVKTKMFAAVGFLACVIGAIYAYRRITGGIDTQTLQYGLWSWFGGAFFMGLIIIIAASGTPRLYRLITTLYQHPSRIAFMRVLRRFPGVRESPRQPR